MHKKTNNNNKPLQKELPQPNVIIIIIIPIALQCVHIEDSLYCCYHGRRSSVDSLTAKGARVLGFCMAYVIIASK